MKKILVPCDFSSSSKEAFRFAVQLAERTRAEVYVLRVTELPVLYEPGMGAPEYGFDQELIQDLAEDAQHKLESLEKDFGISGNNIHLLNETGPVDSTIREVSEELQMDLIVMGTHPLDSWIESVLGTHTRKIVRTASVPVLTIKKFVDFYSIKNIVFPTMLMNEREAVVHEVRFLQRLFGAKLHILFVNKPSDFHSDQNIRKAMDAFIDKYSFENFTTNVYNDQTTARGIIHFTEEIGADLIAMGTQAHRGFVPFFQEHVAEGVLDGTNALLWSLALP